MRHERGRHRVSCCLRGPHAGGQHLVGAARLDERDDTAAEAAPVIRAPTAPAARAVSWIRPTVGAVIS
ncbi:hypothetical protein [Calidifontibacter indicus]|uniref:hypothetical protein n=1 Tax=Calidifontibacter indicus TaxID=419650 RepID=UPI003D7433D0